MNMQNDFEDINVKCSIVLYEDQEEKSRLIIQFLETRFFQNLIEEDSLTVTYPKKKLGPKKRGFGISNQSSVPSSEQKEEGQEEKESKKDILYWSRILENDQNILLSTSNSNYFCIDIDVPAFTSPILRIIRDNKINCFAVKTPRGGCHLIFLKDEYLNEISQRKTQIFFFGLKIELFVKNDVVLIGPHHSIEILPSDPISTLPEYLRFNGNGNGKNKFSYELLSTKHLSDLLENLYSSLQDRLTFQEETKLWFYCNPETNISNN
jgi:hypothetical protein